jgi:hypothetical protein
MTEESLKAKIRALSPEFHVREEIRGRHALYDQNVRIDFMLKAREPLIQSGFTSNWFGVECKWITGINGQTAKTTKLIWQSITYAQSQFQVDGASVTPRFVALLTPDMHASIESNVSAMLSLALYGCVARMYFYRDGSWGIKFASIYARSSAQGYYVSQRQLPNVRAGSIA